MKKILALDFDGLICDGLNECILVTWNGNYDQGVSAFSDQGLEAIPVEFVEQFKHCRNFSKHLGHFIVPLFDLATHINTQDHFEMIYNSIKAEVVNEFVKKVTTYRHRARKERRENWLRYHSLYTGMEGFLSNIHVPTYIVTAKDSESVIEILSSRSIGFDKERIFGEQQSKIAALKQIERLENAKRSEIHFFDDNIMNVVEAKKAGYKAYWATWGYKAPEHIHIAEENLVMSVSLAEFLENTLGIVSASNSAS